MGIIANLTASARTYLARVLPRAQHAPFPAQRALPTNSGPAGEGFGAQTVPMPNIQVINDWIIPSTLGWTLDAMQGAILQLENGNLYAAHSLMLAMTREATVGHGLMVRRMSLSALRWEIRFPQCIPQPARDALLRHWPEAITPQDMATAGSYTVMLGLAPSTQVWFEKTEPTGETYWQFRSEILESGHLQYRPDLRRYYFIARDGYREIVDDGNTWVLYKSLGDRRHHLDSAVRPLATLWFIVQEAIRYWRAYNAEYGRPIKALMVPDQMRLSEDVSQLVSQASGLYGGSVIMLPQFAEGQGTANFDLKLIEAKSRGFQTFGDLIKVCRDLITLYLVGVLETTGGASASNAKAQTQLKVADRYIVGDAQIRCDAINRILRRWADFNGFVDAPEYVIHTEPPEDEQLRAEISAKIADSIKKTADALKAMSDSGVRVDEDRAATLFNKVGVSLRQLPVGEPLAPQLHEGDRAKNSVLVCWQVPAEIAGLLAVPGGQAPEELHCTIAYCPGGDLARVISAIVAVLPSLEIAEGFISGVASWPVREPAVLPVEAETVAGEPAAAEVAPAEPAVAQDRNAKGAGQVPGEAAPPAGQGKPPAKRQLSVTQGGEPEPDTSQLAYVSLLDVPQLAAMREKIVDALTAAGCAVATQHGYIPHITRAYLPAGSGVKAPGEPVPVRLDQVSVWALGGAIRVPMRLQQPAAAPTQVAPQPTGGSPATLPTAPVSLSETFDDDVAPLNLSDADLDDELENLTVELRTYQRGFHGRFGHGTGSAQAKPSKLGTAAKAHSAKAHAEKTLESHRYAARANAAVARAALKRGDVEKAKAHIDAAKAHRDAAKQIKSEAKAQSTAKPVAPAPAKAQAPRVSSQQAQDLLKAAAANNKSINPQKVNADIASVLGKDHDLGSILNGFSVDGHTPRISSISTSGRHVNIEVELSKNGQVTATMSRTLNRLPNGELRVRQGSLFLNELGKGLGSQIVKNNFDFYEKAGVKSASLDAEFTGRYVWAKMGFTAVDGVGKHKEHFDKFLKEQGVSADTSKIQSMHDLATFNHNGRAFGKEFLTSPKTRNDPAHAPGWEGVIAVDRKDAGYQTMRRYLERG